MVRTEEDNMCISVCIVIYVYNRYICYVYVCAIKKIIFKTKEEIQIYILHIHYT